MGIMSGAAGLSAAIRRRAGGNDNDITTLKEQQLNLDDNLNLLLENNSNKFTEIENEVLRLQNIKSHVENVESNESPEDIAYFKDKIKSLEKTIQDLKTLVLKVQNYAM